jgi:hypothetical protein
LNVFGTADKQDRAGRADLYDASIFFSLIWFYYQQGALMHYFFLSYVIMLSTWFMFLMHPGVPIADIY